MSEWGPDSYDRYFQKFELLLVNIKNVEKGMVTATHITNALLKIIKKFKDMPVNQELDLHSDSQEQEQDFTEIDRQIDIMLQEEQK